MPCKKGKSTRNNANARHYSILCELFDEHCLLSRNRMRPGAGRAGPVARAWAGCGRPPR